MSLRHGLRELPLGGEGGEERVRGTQEWRVGQEVRRVTNSTIRVEMCCQFIVLRREEG